MLRHGIDIAKIERFEKILLKKIRGKIFKKCLYAKRIETL